MTLNNHITTTFLTHNTLDIVILLAALVVVVCMLTRNEAITFCKLLVLLATLVLFGCHDTPMYTVGTLATDIKAEYYVSDNCAVGAAKVLLGVQDNMQLEVERQCVTSTVKHISFK